MSERTGAELFDEIHDFVTARIYGQITAEKLQRIEQLLGASAEARRIYVEYLQEMVGLQSMLGTGGPLLPAIPGENADLSAMLREIRDMAVPSAPPLPPAKDQGNPAQPPSAGLSFFGHFLNFGGGTPGAVALTWLVMALCTGMVLGVMVLAIIAVRGIHVHVDGPEVAKAPAASSADHRPPTTDHSAPVARLTRVADCQWAGQHAAPSFGDDLAAGRVLQLKAGLAEITFQSGAMVLLQGPAEMEVASRSSAYLHRGSLTARVERPSAKGFEINTPGMKYTDLGTEFGVLVKESGEQEVDVFRGAVRAEAVELELEPASPNSESEISNSNSEIPNSKSQILNPKSPLVLKANESIRVEKPQGEGPVAIVRQAAKPEQFVRQIPRVIELDLVDILAGGDGTTGLSHGAINPLTGTAVADDKRPNGLGTGVYQRVIGRKYIDGVFVPDGSRGPVQLDSAGHRYALPKTTDEAYGLVHGETVEPLPGDMLARSKLPDSFSGPLAVAHPRLFLHANVGITFDLVAVAASHPGRRPSRFQSALCAVCALHAGRPVVIAAWVFVDGQLLFQKPDLRLADGCLKIDLPISPGARFLTLVATDADLNIGGDHVLFHCPRVLMEEKTE